MGPGRQRCVHQASARIENGEIDRCAGGVEINEEPPQPLRQWLVTSHGCDGVDRDSGRGGGLLDRAGQQGMWGRLTEHPVPVLECGLHRRCESHRIPEVVHPVAGVERRQCAGILQGGREVRHRRGHRREIRERLGQIGEDGVDLGGMRGDVHRDLAGHDVSGFPLRDQFRDGVGRAADHRGLRRGEHRHGDITDSSGGEFVAHLLGGQLDGGHRSAPGQSAHQPRATADHPHTVVERQCAGDHGCGGLAHRVPDDRTRAHPVGSHRGGEPDLHRENRRLDPVDPGHRLGC